MPRLPDNLTEHFELPDEDEYEACLFNEADMAHERLVAREFRQCVFRRCTLTDALLTRAAFVDVIFDHCDLSRANLDSALFQRVSFDTCRLSGADMVQAILRNATLTGCKADYVNLSEAKLDHVAFTDTILTEAAFETVTHKSAEFAGCDLTRATLFRTHLNGLDLRTCTIDGLTVNLPDLRGLIVTPLQAMELSKLLGLVVK